MDEIPRREWLKALAFVVGVGIVVTVAIAWAAFTFFFRSCGVSPCG